MILDVAQLSEADVLLLNRVVERIRPVYNDLIARVSQGYTHDIDWIVSSIASRSIFLSPLVWHCYHLALLHEKIAVGEIPEQVRVYNRSLAGIINAYAVRHGYRMRATYAASLKQQAREKLKPLYQASLAAQLLRWYAAARRVPSSRPLPVDVPLTLVDTFVLDSSFAQGDYSDRYYPGLRDALTDEEREALVYMPTFVGGSAHATETLRNIRASSYRFLLKEDVLQPADYRFAFAHALRRRKFRRFTDVDFLGFDIAPLLNREVTATAWDPSSILALLIYRTVQRLRERGVHLRLVVDWFENQVIDRALHAGLHRWYPGVPTVGYAGYIVSSVYNFYMHPTASEVTAAVVPTEYAVIGAGHEEQMKEFCSALEVGVAPAFRFRGVWRDRTQVPDSSVCRVLVALPITARDSAEILEALLPFAERVGSTRFQFCVKTHPLLPKDRIAAALGRALPPVLEFVDGDFTAWLERSHVLVGNTSSTCVEALAKGVPVVVIGSRSGITQNPIPDSIRDDIWTLCYTADDVAAALEWYAGRDAAARERHEATGRDIRARYFEPVTTEGIRRFLHLPV